MTPTLDSTFLQCSRISLSSHGLLPPPSRCLVAFAQSTGIYSLLYIFHFLDHFFNAVGRTTWFRSRAVVLHSPYLLQIKKTLLSSSLALSTTNLSPINPRPTQLLSTGTMHSSTANVVPIMVPAAAERTQAATAGNGPQEITTQREKGSIMQTPKTPTTPERLVTGTSVRMSVPLDVSSVKRVVPVYGPDRKIARRDSMDRREALLKGKEGSRQRRRWENGMNPNGNCTA